MRICGPALFRGNFGDNSVGGVDVKPPVGLDNFHRYGMCTVDGDMDVKISRILVRRNDCLVFDKPHALKENPRCLNDLFPAWEFIFRPAHDPMGNGHFALNGLLGKRNHLPFPGFRLVGQEVESVGVKQLLASLFVLFGKNVVHKPAYHGGLGLAKIGAPEFLQNHAVWMRASIACLNAQRVRFISSRSSRRPVARTVSKLCLSKPPIRLSSLVV